MSHECASPAECASRIVLPCCTHGLSWIVSSAQCATRACVCMCAAAPWHSTFFCSGPATHVAPSRGATTQGHCAAAAAAAQSPPLHMLPPFTALPRSLPLNLCVPPCPPFPQQPPPATSLASGPGCEAHRLPAPPRLRHLLDPVQVRHPPPTPPDPPGPRPPQLRDLRIQGLISGLNLDLGL